MDDEVRTAAPAPDRAAPAAAPPGAPPGLSAAALAAVVELCPDGVAVQDAASGAYVYVNPSGRELLAAGHRRGRRIERSSSPLVDGGRELAVHFFRDVTAVDQRERHLAAFSRTSASIAFAGPLATVLDRLAEQVREATGIFACTFLLMDERGQLRQVGTTDQGYPGVDDYADRLERCRALGAPLLSAVAFSERRPVVATGWRQRTLGDPRFAPLHGIGADTDWSTLAAVPVIGRGRIIGILNGFYAAGAEPDDGDLAFLTAIADQAAVAVENARLLGALESKAALEERHLLARELHDSVNQALFSLALQTRALEIGMATGRTTTEHLARGLVEVRELTEGALAEMRALIFQLRPAALHEEGLVVAVRKHASALAAREGLRVRVEGPAAAPCLDPAVEEQLFRVVQEALANVVKHAGATEVAVTFTADPPGGSLCVSVRDDGAGFDPGGSYPGHLGLQSMAERVAQVGGTFSIESGAGATTVRATVPGATAAPAALRVPEHAGA